MPKPEKPLGRKADLPEPDPWDDWTPEQFMEHFAKPEVCPPTGITQTYIDALWKRVDPDNTAKAWYDLYLATSRELGACRSALLQADECALKRIWATVDAIREGDIDAWCEETP